MRERKTVRKGLVFGIVFLMVFVTFAGIPMNVSAEGTCPEGMVSYWKFDEDSGTTVSDSIGNNDGTIYGALRTTGIVGNALSFDGVNDYVAIPYHSSLSPITEITLESWIKGDTFAGGKNVISKTTGISGSSPYWDFYEYTLTMMDNRGVQFVISSGGHERIAKTPAGLVNVGVWQHIAASYDGYDLRIYINGEEKGSYHHVGTITPWDTPLDLGRYSGRPYGGYGAGAYSFDGLMDEVAIYSRALIPEEIEQHYQNGLEGKGYCYAAPDIESITGPVDPVKVNTEVQMTGTFTGSEASDTYTATWDWGDDSSSPGIVDSFEVTGTHQYIEAGVYTVTLTVMDSYDESDSVTYQYVVVYDPEGGFVTGGGWIDSPAGAYVADPDCPEGMVSYWKLDEDSGTTASDSVDENHGTLVNGPTWTTGQVGGALSFDGVNDYVNCGHDLSLEIPNSFSVSAWFKTISEGCLVSKASDGAGLYNMLFHLGSQGRVVFSVFDGYNYPAARTTNGYYDGEWHFAVGIRDTVAKKLYVYIDGNKEVVSADDTTTGSINDPIRDVIIGAYTGETKWLFEGPIDEVAIYNRPLTPEEIQQHYQNGLEGKGYCYVAPPEGKANFGFVSKYKKGAEVPTGNTEFQFKAGNLNFHSSNYEWLVVANAKAQFKGTGTINGEGNYGFMLTAVDEKLTPSTDIDLFRIKIWDKDNNDAIVYDNNMDAADDAEPTTKIAGGQIVIHKAK